MPSTLSRLWSRLRYSAAALGAAAVVVGASFGAEAATVELKNDGWNDGDAATFHDGFVTSEEGAVTLGPVNEAFTIDKVRFLFGGMNTDTVTITLVIYAENGTTNPGTILFSADYNVTGADNGIQEIDLTTDNVMVSGGSFRVSIRLQHDNAPGLANDLDGITPGRNWIFAGAWVSSSVLKVKGDWIIRAEITTMGGGTGGSGPSTSSSGSGAAGGMSGGGGKPGTPATSGGQVCTPGQSIGCVGPGACDGGQTCAADGMSYDACVCGEAPEEEGGCGCVVAGRQEQSARALAALSGLALLGLVAVRRRRRGNGR